MNSKETLEEAINRIATLTGYDIEGGPLSDFTDGFVRGVDWMLERTYSEEEIKGLIIKFWEQFPDKWDIEAWIEENKKK